MRIYLAGPMSGIPDFNFPAFERAAKQLRDLGHDVVSPHEMHATATSDSTQASWPQLMRQALSMMLTCDAVYLLRGWSDSKGAKIEWRLAHDLSFTVLYQSIDDTNDDFEPIPL